MILQLVTTKQFRQISYDYYLSYLNKQIDLSGNQPIFTMKRSKQK